MKWRLYLWAPGWPSWRGVGEVVDGADDNIRQAVVRGLLGGFEGSAVHCRHDLTRRNETYRLDGGTVVRVALGGLPVVEGCHG